MRLGLRFLEVGENVKRLKSALGENEILILILKSCAIDGEKSSFKKLPEVKITTIIKKCRHDRKK